MDERTEEQICDYYNSDDNIIGTPWKWSLGKMRSYVASGDIAELEGTTFFYIAMFLDQHIEYSKLKIGAKDFGYTLKELQLYRQRKKNGIDLAKEILRKYER